MQALFLIANCRRNIYSRNRNVFQHNLPDNIKHDYAFLYNVPADTGIRIRSAYYRSHLTKYPADTVNYILTASTTLTLIQAKINKK